MTATTLIAITSTACISTVTNTEPAVIEPAITESAVTEPAVAEPAVAEPASTERCAKRTKIMSFNAELMHDPVSKGECLKCHSLHNTDYPNLLKAPLGELCMECHAKGIADLPPLSIYQDKLMNQHKPFEEGKCLCCHEPHVSDHINLLSGDYPQNIYATYTDDKILCLECHQKEAFDEPRTLTDTNFRNGNLNLHFRHVNRKKGRTCRVCHHHHGAEFPALIRDSTPFGSNNINITSFEKTESGGSCKVTCHIVARYDRYEAAFNAIKVTPRLGIDADEEELLKLKEEHRQNTDKSEEKAATDSH